MISYSVDDGRGISTISPQEWSVMFSKDNLRVYLRTHWEGQGEKLAENQRLGVDIAELIEHSRKRNEAIDAPHLDLWVTILDELNSWMVSLFSIVYGPAKHDDRKLNDFERSIVVLLLRLISDTTAMRHLVTLGFDSSARTLMRSISEYMQVLVAIIDEPSLATAFVTADTPETSNAFYFQQLARGKLHKRTMTAWARFFRSEGDAAAAFTERQRKNGLLLSGTAHPSFAGGHLAAINFIKAEPNENWLGHWGAKSNLSVTTIGIYTDCFMPLLLLSNFPFEGFDGLLTAPISYDASDEMHRHVKAGRSVLGSLILSLNTESNFPHVYPEEFEPNIPADPDAIKVAGEGFD